MNYFLIYYLFEQMSFLTKNINYSQAVYLKNKLLQPLLQTYNTFLLEQKIVHNNFLLNKDINTGLSFEMIIPNNNIKYFLFVTKKSNLETTKDNYNILYFFPDQMSSDYFKTNKNITNTLSDFYMEIDHCFDKDFLFEGYLYKTANKYQFLITDLLFINTDIISSDYNIRITIINEIIMNLNLIDLNNQMSINIHPIFNKINEKLIKIFKDNFIYKNDICSIEVVDNLKKTRYLDVNNLDQTIKIIQTTKLSDVYKVYNDQTNDFEGILYIKGLLESKKIKQLFTDRSQIQLKCSYNNTFKKWEPLF